MRISAKLAMAQSPSSTHSTHIWCRRCVGRRLRRALTKKQRRERLLLVQFNLAFPHELERGREA
jgi:hypothetical protein